jgi:hypothetical protein
MATSPEEFRDQMQAIFESQSDDFEAAHSNMDGRMTELLTELGYGEGVEIFEAQEKWYA